MELTLLYIFQYKIFLERMVKKVHIRIESTALFYIILQKIILILNWRRSIKLLTIKFPFGTEICFHLALL